MGDLIGARVQVRQPQIRTFFPLADFRCELAQILHGALQFASRSVSQRAFRTEAQKLRQDIRLVRIRTSGLKPHGARSRPFGIESQVRAIARGQERS